MSLDNHKITEYLDNHKITEYKDSVKTLDDYPTLSATELKAVFDSRSDNEIMDKHNGLINELKGIIADLEEADGTAEQNAKDYAAGRAAEAKAYTDKLKSDLEDGEISVMFAGEADMAYQDGENNVITATYETKTAATSKLTEAKSYTDELKNNLTSGSIRVENATKAVSADEAGIAFCDGEGNDIYETYATKDELNAVSGEAVIAESKAYTDDLERRLENNSIDDTYVNWAYFCDDAYTAQCDMNGNDIMETYATKDEVGTLQSNLTSGSIRVAEASYAGNADNAASAEQDFEANVIHEHYETKTEANSKLTEAKAYTDKLKFDLENGIVWANDAWNADAAKQSDYATAADTAKRDGNENVIHETYATKEEVGTLQTNLTSGSITVKKATNAAMSDEASIAWCDGEGNDIYETYATKEELNAYIDEAILGGAW